VSGGIAHGKYIPAPKRSDRATAAKEEKLRAYCRENTAPVRSAKPATIEFLYPIREESNPDRSRETV